MPKMQHKPTDVVLRPFVRDDFGEIAKLMARTWLGEFQDTPAITAACLELCEYLDRSSWALVAERGDNLLGAVLLDEKGHCEQPDPQLDGWSEAARQIADDVDESEAAAVRAACEAELGGVAEENALAREFCATGAPESATAVKLLIIAPESRGLGLGRRLLDAAAERVRSIGAAGYYLLTDDACDVGFYDHLGLRQAIRRRSQAFWPSQAAPQVDDFCIYVYAREV